MVNYKETLVKTLIWRVIATTITILTGWIVSGNWKFGLAIGGIDTIIKTISYFGYERVWYRYSKFGINERDKNN